MTATSGIASPDVEAQDGGYEMDSPRLDERGLLEIPSAPTEQPKPTTGASRFLFWILINTLATIAIVCGSHRNVAFILMLWH